MPIATAMSQMESYELEMVDGTLLWTTLVFKRLFLFPLIKRWYTCLTATHFEQDGDASKKSELANNRFAYPLWLTESEIHYRQHAQRPWTEQPSISTNTVNYLIQVWDFLSSINTLFDFWQIRNPWTPIFTKIKVNTCDFLALHLPYPAVRKNFLNDSSIVLALLKPLS